MGHSNLRHVLNAAYALKLHEINHIIWKYNFGVYTKKKYVTSHYHILYYSKSIKSKNIFNTYCRFGSQEKTSTGKSLLYQDLEDVFIINKEYDPKIPKNQNKLPNELVRKMILYSSNAGDMVCDFFMGNFTTAYNAIKLGRKIVGYEINKSIFDHHISKLGEIKFGCDLDNMKKVVNVVPKNQGKKIEEGEIASIRNDYKSLLDKGLGQGEVNLFLQQKYGRGKFSIKNIIDKYCKGSK